MVVQVLQLSKNDSKPVKIGKYYNDNYFTIKINQNTDCYVDKKLIFSFRKNVFNIDFSFIL